MGGLNILIFIGVLSLLSFDNIKTRAGERKMASTCHRDL
jgi:hypothetical protein